jgi:hypothetical protein
VSALRKDRLLREALGDREGQDDLPGVEGIMATGAIVAALLVFVLFVG